MAVFNVIAGACSILSLLITISVWFKVREIEAEFTSRVRLPVYRRKLRTLIGSLKQHREQKDDANIRSVLAVCRTVLLDMAAHLADDRRRDQVKNAISNISELLSAPKHGLWARCDAVIDELAAVDETVGNLIDELPWRVTNAR